MKDFLGNNLKVGAKVVFHVCCDDTMALGKIAKEDNGLLTLEQDNGDIRYFLNKEVIKINL